MATTGVSNEEHFQRLVRLLNLEAQAEKEEALRDMQRPTAGAAEAAGTGLTGLVVREQDAGLGGRILLTLGKRDQSLPLPWTRLRVGAPVILSEEGSRSGRTEGTSGWRGIVTRLQRDSLQLALAEWPDTDSEQPTFRLDRSNDEISRDRQRQGLDRARAAHDSRLAGLREVLIGHRAASFKPLAELDAFNKDLNGPQLEAVRFALSAEDVAIILGPPGTGKTTTLAELIGQIVRAGERVLAVAPSNIAVDNLLVRLLATGVNAIRLGHPARVLPEVRAHSLDLLVENHAEVRLAHKWMKEAHALHQRASRFTRARPEPGARRAMHQEARQLLLEARRLEEQVVQRILGETRVVCATSTGLDPQLLLGQAFDWCIMDEAAQSTEAAAWAPLQYAQRLVLAGDHRQLPPTIVSRQAADEGFGTSLPERLLDQLGSGISRGLTIQYRMHRQIMEFSSREFYQGALRADGSVADHLLQDMPGITAGDLTGSAVTFIDTAGASFDETLEPDGDSRFNASEAQVVVERVRDLMAAGMAAADLAVISPYSAQVRLLRSRIAQAELEIDSVDGFQGREKEAVIVSLVRSNPDNEIGFLADVRRMNVALTRARRKLIVIGDSATITAHPFYERLVNYFESIGAYRSVWEYPDH